MRKIILISSMFFISLSFNLNAYADWRSYVWTYEYMTMPKGKFEVEYYLTYEQKEITKAMPNSSKAIKRFLAWVEKHQVKFLLSEQQIYSRKYEYTGTLDFI